LDQGEPGRDREEPRGLEDWLAHFLTDPMLRPVLVVAIGCFTALGAGAILLAIQGRSLPALAALTLLALGTADLLQRDLRRRRFGRAVRLVLALWTLSGLAAAAAVAFGIA
jgi:hypothetical protein